MWRRSSAYQRGSAWPSAPRKALQVSTSATPYIVLAVIAVLSWFGGMGWLLRDTLAAPMAPVALVQLIAALCVPPALIGIIYLLGQRGSAAEARRFGATSRAMRAEAAALERTVAALSARIEETRSASARMLCYT